MKEYSNGEITVIWNEKKCIHSGHCVRSLSSVFNPRARPWVNMQGGGSEEITKVIDGCPSKALTYKR